MYQVWKEFILSLTPGCLMNLRVESYPISVALRCVGSDWLTEGGKSNQRKKLSVLIIFTFIIVFFLPLQEDESRR